MCQLPCLRWIITDASLHREQDRPFPLHSTRWPTMDLVDINTWASSEIRTITLSQIFLKAPYEVQVREFKPVDGDMLCSNGKGESYHMPRYAIANMHQTAAMLEAFIEQYIPAYIDGALSGSDTILWRTYMFAYRFANTAKVCQVSR